MTDLNNNHHPELALDPADGQPYVEELTNKLIELCSSCQTIIDIEERFRKLYPESKLVDLAIREAHKARNETNSKSHKGRNHSSSSGSSLLHNITSFAVPLVNYLVREGVVSGSKGESELDRFRSTIIQFIINDVVHLAEDFVTRQKGNFIITRSDIRTAMHADKDLLDIFLSDDKNLLTIDNHPILCQVMSANKNCGQHNNDQRLATLTYKQKVRSMVDSENTFIECNLKLLIKVFKAQLEKLPHVKSEVQTIFCNIEELLELSSLLLASFEDALESVGSDDEIPYVGSEILDSALNEEFQAYFNFAHRRLSPEWKQAFSSITNDESIMTSIRTAGQHFDLAVKNLLPTYLLNIIIQFFKYYENISDLYELSKRHNNIDDRFALKETISILIKTKRAIEELLKPGLEQVEPIDPKHLELIQSTLDKRLAAELQHERNMPLPHMPPPEIYRFSEPDSDENIQFEKAQNYRTISSSNKDSDKQFRSDTTQTPVIKCATLIKLVERLTYHKYQPNFLDAFLTTYRSFTTDPEEFLDLLIERFKIPDPPLSVVFENFNGSQDDLSENERIFYKHYIKRFRQEYSKPVKMRVINVLKSWIKNHYYDFERHPTLLNKLHSFLDDVYYKDKILRSLIVSIKKSIEQKKSSQREELEVMLSDTPPPVMWWAVRQNEPEKFDLLTLHPVEFARQVTLIEFDLFRAIKPSELINVHDLGYRKEDKYESSPNLSRMTRHFTLLSYWIRMCIVETEDFDKRSAIYNRVFEIMGVLRDLNNFTGLLSIGSAVESAPIKRLKHTSNTLTHTTRNIMEDYGELNANHQRKLESELKKCNPPCIPYLGSYQTKLIHLKEGNKTFIDEADAISPTLSNDEFHSSFSNSPATPISPRTPLPRTTPNLPPSATSTIQNQFFGGCMITRPMPININAFNNNNNQSNGHGNNGSNGNGIGNGNGVTTNGMNSNLQQQPPQSHQQTPLTPASPKMINFTKQRIRASLVAEISNYQNPPYCLEVQPEIRQYIESIEPTMIRFASNLCSTSKFRSGSVVSSLTEKEGYSIERDIPALTKRLDDYLFEQSERIEPKNCQKPQRSKSKLPDHWKSPGIKINNCATPK